jgi:hypothetical protein
MVWIDTYKRQKKQGLDRKSRLDLNHRADETKPIQCRTIEGVMFGGEMARPSALILLYIPKMLQQLNRKFFLEER